MTKAAAVATSDVDTAYGGNPETALKVPDAVSVFAYVISIIIFAGMDMQHTKIIMHLDAAACLTATCNIQSLNNLYMIMRHVH